ncbi:MAG: hypothetical protein AAGA66_10815 [Bacteroidota bacterium]
MEEEEEIVRFINGQMGEEERRVFNAKLSTDANLQEQVAQSRRIRNVVDQETVAFEDTVRAVIEKNRRRKAVSPFWLAACIVAMLLVGSLYYVLRPTSPVLLAEQYLEPYPDVLTSRSAESSIDLTFYNKGDYRRTIALLQPLFNASKEPVTGLYLGVSYLMQGSAEEALTIFQQVDTKGTVLEKDFLWYQSLALIKLRQFDAAMEKLEILKKDSTYYSKKASNLLSKLD